MKKNILSLFICIILISVSCKDDVDNNEQECINVKEILKKWTFLGLYYSNTNIKEFKPDNIREIYIEFETQSYSGHSSCNGYSGEYCTYGKDSIRFDSKMTTNLVACNDTSVDWNTDTDQKSDHPPIMLLKMIP